MSNEDFLFGGGGASAKFENIGDTISGQYLSDQVTQQTDFKTGKPKFWDDGNPVLQLVVTLQTDLRDPSIADDDGKRNLYVKGSKKPGSQSLHDAVATAVKQSGAKGLQPGGTLTVRFIGTEPTDAGSPRKLYAAQYVPPAANFLGTQQQAPAQAAPADPWGQAAPAVAQVAPQPVQQMAQPVAQTATAVAAPGQPTPEQVAAVRSAGADPATVWPGWVDPAQPPF